MDTEIQKSEENKYPFDLILVILITIIAGVLVLLLPDGNIIRILFGLPLLLLFPGYSIVSVLWPGRTGLTSLERLATSIGLSIVFVSVIGLFTSSTIGLSLTNVLSSVTALIMIMSGIAVYRRAVLPAADRYDPMYVSLVFGTLSRSNKIFTVSICVAIIIVGLFMFLLLLSPPSSPEGTSFYILDNEGTLLNLPLNISTNQTSSIIVGISCQEGSLTQYTVTTRMGQNSNPQLEENWSSLHVINQNMTVSRMVSIDHEEVFEDTFMFMFPEAGDYRLEWNLQVGINQEEYELHLWINVND